MAKDNTKLVTERLPTDLRQAARIMKECDNTFETGQAIMLDAADEIEELRSALKAMVGVFDTPISRRKIGGEYAQEARKLARSATSTNGG